MPRIIASFILLAFVSVVFCGFVVNHQMGQHAAHASADSTFVEHHFSMWTDFSTALVTDVVTYSTLFALVIASAFFIAQSSSFLLSLLNVRLLPARVPIGVDEQRDPSYVLRRWLSLFEHSPSFA